MIKKLTIAFLFCTFISGCGGEGTCSLEELDFAARADTECVGGWFVKETISPVDDSLNYSFVKFAEERFEGSEIDIPPWLNIICSEGSGFLEFQNVGPLELNDIEMTDVTIRFDDKDAIELAAENEDEFNIIFAPEVAQAAAVATSISEQVVLQFSPAEGRDVFSTFRLAGWTEASEGHRDSDCGFIE